MGNQLGLIKVYKAKEYDPFRANIHYLSRIVNICLRCKINKAAPRKRVCTFCIVDDRNDRVKIAEYYNNPGNNVKHKTEIEIQKDLIEKLKIELNLIPLVYRSECNNVDVETGKCSSKGASKCSFIHNETEKIFGDKLFSLRQNAIKRQYKAQGEFELNDYDAVKLQLFYRKIIGQYYNIWWKHSGNTIESTKDNMDKIKQYLIDKNIKLYLIPTVYKNWCYYAKDIDPICSRKSHLVCTFIHDEKQLIFGDILWKIKYDALEEREMNNQQQIQQQEITTQDDVNLLDEDENELSNIDEKKIDLGDKWWKDAILPYKEANEEEHAADKDLAETWRMDSTNIYIQAEEMEYFEGRDIDSDDEYIGYSDDDNDSNDDDNDNDNDQTIIKHTLYVEYEDIKSAKIKPNRTYVDFTFKCKYKVSFEEINCEQEIRNIMEKCDLISTFMHECKLVADWLRSNITNRDTGEQDRIMNRIYKNYKSRIHILNIIASFAVIKDKTYPKCVACYFNICDGIKHKLLKNKCGHLQMYRNCCNNDFDTKRTHDFDTRRCDQLHGVVLEKLMPEIDINSNEKLDSHPRYKVLINRKTTNIDTYLKFLLIGSNKYNILYRDRRKFQDVLVSYPCNTHQFIQIKAKLKLLYNAYDEDNIHRQNEITQIIFGYNAIKPRLILQRNIDRKLIKKLFRRLNSSQIDAIYGALNYNMHSIQGPPATGKTKTCAHISYLWWMNGLYQKQNKIKIHGMTPTNQGTLLLAQKCMEMNDIMEERPSLDANRVIDGFIRMTINKRIPSSIRELCLKFYYDDRNNNDKSKPKRKFKVLYFASKTYTNILDVKLALQKKNGLQMHNNKNNCSKYCDDGMTMMEILCVNLAARNKCRQQANYSEWGEKKKESWMQTYIVSELKSADMICTTFGNSTHKIIRELFEYEFTHAICDESNQSSLDTFLGIIGYENLQHLCMAGDIRQLAPVTMSQNELARISVYEHIIEYLTNMTFIPNKYYTRLNKQYRSHPQIYNITTSIFYNKTVNSNDDMKYIRSYIKNKKNYCQLFGNKNNHIQFHMLTNIQKQIDTSSQRHSKYNVKEVRIAVKYLRKFIIEYGYSEKDIAVISDYSAQIDCLYDHLVRIKQINSDKILLCTTNEIEGSSKPIVIYMCCRSNNTGNIGFLNDITRINVATSRAEYGQIIIGDIYTLQYNPIYKQIFDIHQKCGAVVYEENVAIKESINKPIPINQKHKNKKHKHNKKKKKKLKHKHKQTHSLNLKTVSDFIPLVSISAEHVFKERQKYLGKNRHRHSDYVICGGCENISFIKLFCGRIISTPPIYIYYCDKCIDKYLKNIILSFRNGLFKKFSEISPITIISKTDLNCSNSFGIELEFDLLLGKYLQEYGLTKFKTNNKIGGNYGLYNSFCKIALSMYKNISEKDIKKRQFIPQCFKKLALDYKNKTFDNNMELIRSDQLRNKAIGIMECKRTHLLIQSTMDSRFFRLVYQIKNCRPELQQYYKKNKFTFYEYREFESSQPTLIIVAYLKACGYSTNIANYLHRRVGKLLFDKNIDRQSRNTQPIKLDEEQIEILVNNLKLNEFENIINVLSPNNPSNVLNGYYVIELLQNAIISDPMSTYYERRKQARAIGKEHDFGAELIKNGFYYYSEKELQDLGYKDTPDYYLKKPWCVYYNNIKYEITWIDFKYYYCSSTQWVFDKLRFQAIRYNKTFGPGAFIFSLGYCKIPIQTKLKLNSNGLLAALPLSQENIETFIKLRSKQQQQQQQQLSK